MNEDPTTISAPAIKAGAAIASAAGAQVVESASKATSIFSDLLVLNWPNIASAAAAIYTLALLAEFCWKKFWRPFFERIGLIKPKPRLVLTPSEWAALRPTEDE